MPNNIVDSFAPNRQQYCSALLHLIVGSFEVYWTVLLTIRNNFAPTTLLHRVFNNPEQLMIFSCVCYAHRLLPDICVHPIWSFIPAYHIMSSRFLMWYKCSRLATRWTSSTWRRIVRRKVCFHYNGDCCYKSLYIDVINCPGMFVYGLKNTVFGFSARYCFEDDMISKS